MTLTMSEVKVINKGDKFAHASVGSLKAFEGKQFVNIYIQAKEGSLGKCTADDADITTHENKM